MNYNDFPQKDIFCIDMKCFYASCIAMLEGLDVLTDPIAVIGNFEQPGSIVLAASPVMKEKFNIKTGNRRYEIPKHPDIKLFEPKCPFSRDVHGHYASDCTICPSRGDPCL